MIGLTPWLHYGREIRVVSNKKELSGLHSVSGHFQEDTGALNTPRI